MSAVPERSDERASVKPLREAQERTDNVTVFSARPGPRRFTRVPTHAIGVASERRAYPRASLSLPLRLIRIGPTEEAIPVSLVTRNISSSGVYFLAPREIPMGAAVHLEVALIERPFGCGRVQMYTAAHVVRVENTDTPSWWGYAASFDDFALRRDDALPPRYSTP